MSSVTSTITLSELCFPDCAQKVIRAWGQVNFSSGSYVSGGLAMNLFAFLDQRTVDVNGFLRCRVWGEDVVTATTGLGVVYHYSPVTDVLQIVINGIELANGAAIPALVLTDTILFECSVNRTTVLG
jgi:hypothetical protein